MPINDVFNALSATLGNYYVNDFNKYGRAWQVLMSADPAYRNAARRHRRRVRALATRGEMVPLNSLATRAVHLRPRFARPLQQPAGGQDLRQGAPGISSGQAIARVEQIAKEVLPADFSYDWGGTSYQEKRSGGASTFALALAVIMVFLILAAQYEKWSLPLSVLLALPFGTFGALAAIWLRGLTNDVYFQIGLVTLLGLAAKNAILIVEYAVLKKHEGMSASAAAIEAARLRFRPILMTSLAFIFGVLPLAISTGAGAGARHSTGTGVMGGMIAATFLAIFFVPLFYRLITDRRLREKRTQGPAPVRGRAPHDDGTRTRAARRRAIRRAAWMPEPDDELRTRSVASLVAAALAGCAVTQPVAPKSTCRPAPPPRRRTSSSSTGGPRSTIRCSTRSSRKRSPTTSTCASRWRASRPRARKCCSRNPILCPSVDLSATRRSRISANTSPPLPSGVELTSNDFRLAIAGLLRARRVGQVPRRPARCAPTT